MLRVHCHVDIPGIGLKEREVEAGHDCGDGHVELGVCETGKCSVLRVKLTIAARIGDRVWTRSDFGIVATYFNPAHWRAPWE